MAGRVGRMLQRVTLLMWPGSFRRTCRACGDTWTVPRKLGRSLPPSGRRRGWAMADMRAAGIKAMSGAYMEMMNADRHRRDATADHEAAVLAAANHCPRCGAADYAQERLRSRGPG